jgi:hypothetical protein
LPYFAAFDLLKDGAGRAALQKYFCTYAAMARQYEVGCILESATWRASADWGGCCGTDHRHVEEICRTFLVQLYTWPFTNVSVTRGLH